MKDLAWLTCGRILSVTHGHWLILSRKIASVFPQILSFQSLLIHDLLNQYQACLSLFECISHGHSQDMNEIQ